MTAMDGEENRYQILPLAAVEGVYCRAAGEKKVQAKQLYEWMHVHKAASYGEMTNLPKSLRRQLDEETDYTCLRQGGLPDAQAGRHEKASCSPWRDGNMVESVLDALPPRKTVSASPHRWDAVWDALLRLHPGRPGAKSGSVGNAGSDLPDRAGYRGAVSNVVVMGTGEPLDNYDNLLAFIRMLTDEHGCHISQRNVTVSTCRIVPRIRQLAEKLQITLALSSTLPIRKCAWN